MRSIVLLAILGLICVSQGEVLRGSILTFNSKGALKSSSQTETYKYSDLMSLYKHSMGLPLTLEERGAEKFVSEFQRGNVFESAQLNYMIIMEGVKQEDSENLILRQKKIELEIDESKPSKKLVEQIYETRDEQSIGHQLLQNYLSNEDLSIYYFSQTNVNNKYFQNFGFSVKQNHQKVMQLVKTHNGKTINRDFDLTQCFSTLLNKQYIYVAEKNLIVKRSNTNMRLEINQDNIHDVSLMIEEVCGSLQFSKLIVKGDRPNFVTFHFASLKSLSSKLNKESLELVLDIWKATLNQLISNFETNFAESTLGVILYAESEQVSKYIVEAGNIEFIPHNTQFNQIQKQIISQRRNLAADDDFVRYPNYQIRIWFSIFFIVMLYFVLYALVNAKPDRDSLLYAKFLTNDIKN